MRKMWVGAVTVGCLTAVFLLGGRIDATGGQSGEAGNTPPPAVVRASKILSASVENPRDETLGRVHDLALRFDEGRISYLVLGHGGVLWVGDSYVAVPWDELSLDTGERVLLDLGPDDLEQVPDFALNATWPHAVAWPPVTSTTAGEADEEDLALQIGVLRGRAMIGMRVRNHDGDDLGQVEDLAIRREDGHIAYVVIAHGGVFGIGDSYIAVPLDQLEIDATQGAIVLGLSSSELAEVPSFAETWPAAVDWPVARR